ncbi:MAG: N-formylglutamate amidohydrolase [Alphaproteobacteria bacterium]|nr:N-formylglutamate amidohydrolase [Alphaproteobacteria bacterium]
MHAPAAPAEPPLLQPDDPPVFEILGGERGAPLLLVCDHASRAVPRRLAKLGLQDAVLMRHIGWDIGAAEVTRGLAQRLDAPAVLAGYSRLVVDCNRDLDDPTAMPEVSDGVVIPGNRSLSPAARAARVAACFDPYHAAIADRLAAFAARGAVPVILSIHSFTPVMNGIARPWHIGVLWNRDPRVAVPLIAELAAADPRRIVGDNEPYSAREPAGYTIRAHAEPAGLPHAAVEIRQDLIDTPAGAAQWADNLAAALAPILARREIYRAQRF